MQRCVRPVGCQRAGDLVKCCSTRCPGGILGLHNSTFEDRMIEVYKKIDWWDFQKKWGQQKSGEFFVPL